MDFGHFLNPFAQDAQNFWTAVFACAAALGLFGYFYNRWVGDLGKKSNGLTSFLVAGGTLFTLLMVAIFSWKAAVLCFLAFAVDGAFMMVGDVARAFAKLEKETGDKRKPRKPLPYAAAALLDDGIMALADSQRLVKVMLRDGIDAKKLGLVGMQIAEAMQKLIEARKVEGE